ncbi:MAG TPA: nucleotide-binding protein [Vicinamibacterales bacterium]|nr:nucleotide-binding protein [Vicinamibacterales bacterium]
MPKPAMFIGSSTEGLGVARAIRDLLHDDADITMWNEGFFALGSTFIETLVNHLPTFDFAVLVFTPDDHVTSHHITSQGPRDNIVFELGLFVGRLGRSRTFVLNSDVKMPSDLAGVTTARFEWTTDSDAQLRAVAPACDSIRRAITTLGLAPQKTSAAIDRLASRQDEQAQQLSAQGGEIRALRMVLKGIVTEYEFDKLTGLEQEGSFLCYYSEDLYQELKRLRAMGLIHHHDGTGLRDIKRDFKDRNAQFDLKRFFYITDEGREYVRLRETFDVE